MLGYKITVLITLGPGPDRQKKFQTDTKAHSRDGLPQGVVFWAAKVVFSESTKQEIFNLSRILASLAFN